MPKELPLLNRRLCIQCGDCVAICPTYCLSVLKTNPSETILKTNHPENAAGYPYLKRPFECISCQACVLICPTQAIQMK